MDSSSGTKNCKNKTDSICYICVITYLSKTSSSFFVKHAYKAYFPVLLGDQEKKRWLPIVCYNFEETFQDQTKKGLSLGVA